jgi:3-oxoadipate enol-lactonase
MAETVVFLHPIVGTAEFWDVQVEALAPHYHCVALNAPGYGGTDLINPLTSESVAAWITASLDDRGVERAHLVGLSLGGMFALYAMQHCPERVGKVVLADTSAAFGIDPHEWLDGWLAPLTTGQSPAQLAGDAIDAIVAHPLDSATRASLVDSFSSVSPDAFQAASKCIAFHNVRDALAGMDHECLVIVGEHDEETPQVYAEELATLLPNAKLEVIAGAGHLTSVEAPDAFNSLLGAFLA